MDFRLSRTGLPLIVISIVALGWASLPAGEPENVARISRVADEVQLIDKDATRVAVGDENVNEGTDVRTGANGRAELTFRGDAIVRLGVATGLKFKDGARHLELSEGVVLMHLPKNAGHVKMEGPLVGADLKNTTAVFEFHPTIYKLLVLNGTARLFRPGHIGDSVLVNAGQMVFGNPKMALSDPVDFDISHFVKTCRLITDFAPLRGEKVIASAGEEQKREKSKKDLIDTNLVIFGGGSVVSIINPAQTGLLDQATGVSTQPPPTATTEPSDLGRVETLSTSGATPSPTP
jgi:hypothetical protein